MKSNREQLNKMVYELLEGDTNIHKVPYRVIFLYLYEKYYKNEAFTDISTINDFINDNTIFMLSYFETLSMKYRQ